MRRPPLLGAQTRFAQTVRAGVGGHTARLSPFRRNSSVVLPLFLYEDTQDDERESGRDRCQEEDGADGETRHADERGGENRAEDGAGIVESPVQSERRAAPLGRRRRRDHGVARRRSDPLADPVEEADEGDDGPDRGDADEGPCHRREAVAEEDERLFRFRPVGPAPRDDLRRRGGRLRDPLDPPERLRRCPGKGGEKGREERHDHLGGDVGQERDPAEPDDRGRKALRRGRIGGDVAGLPRGPSF